MDYIVNLTGRRTSATLRNEGVIEPVNPGIVRDLLHFDSVPTFSELVNRSSRLAEEATKTLANVYSTYEIAHREHRALIAGPPFIISHLTDELLYYGFIPMFSVSARVEAEVTKPDGSPGTIHSFMHIGFVEVEGEE